MVWITPMRLVASSAAESQAHPDLFFTVPLASTGRPSAGLVYNNEIGR